MTLYPTELSPRVLLLFVVAEKFTHPYVETTNYSLKYLNRRFLLAVYPSCSEF